MTERPQHVLPFDLAAATRPLADEPLTAGDWAAVWVVQQGYLAMLRLIVDRARQRAAGSGVQAGRVADAQRAVIEQLRAHQDDLLRHGHSLCGPLWDALDRLDAAEREAQG